MSRMQTKVLITEGSLDSKLSPYPIYYGLYENLFNMGAIWPAGQKMPESDSFEMKLGRITKRDSRITKNPNVPRITSL